MKRLWRVGWKGCATVEATRSGRTALRRYRPTLPRFVPHRAAYATPDRGTASLHATSPNPLHPTATSPRVRSAADPIPPSPPAVDPFLSFRPPNELIVIITMIAGRVLMRINVSRLIFDRFLFRARDVPLSWCGRFSSIYRFRTFRHKVPAAYYLRSPSDRIRAGVRQDICFRSQTHSNGSFSSRLAGVVRLVAYILRNLL